MGVKQQHKADTIGKNSLYHCHWVILAHQGNSDAPNTKIGVVVMMRVVLMCDVCNSPATKNILGRVT